MKNLNVFTTNMYAYRNPLRTIFYSIPQFFRNIKYAWQRATKGYCDADLWSLDSFYSNLFTSSIREFSKIAQSTPIRIYDKYDGDENQEEKASAEWHNILNEIADHFEKTETFRWDFLEKPEGMSDKDFYMGLAKLEEIELNKGFDLLKENFRSLWD